MSVTPTLVSTAAAATTESAHTNVSASQASLGETARSTLMTASTILARMVAHVLTRSTTSSVSVIHHLMARPAKVKWTPVLETLVPMEQSVHPTETIKSSAAHVPLATLERGVRWTLMSVPQHSLARMVPLVSTPMAATLVSAPVDMKEEIAC